jgi:hypothetical protein
VNLLLVKLYYIYQNLLYSECQKFGIMEIRMYFLPVELFEKKTRIRVVPICTYCHI